MIRNMKIGCALFLLLLFLYLSLNAFNCGFYFLSLSQVLFPFTSFSKYNDHVLSAMIIDHENSLHKINPFLVNKWRTKKKKITLFSTSFRFVFDTQRANGTKNKSKKEFFKKQNSTVYVGVSS